MGQIPLGIPQLSVLHHDLQQEFTLESQLQEGAVHVETTRDEQNHTQSILFPKRKPGVTFHDFVKKQSRKCL